jgi:hypothetical protein
MAILPEIRPWRLLYVLRGSWVDGNITREKPWRLFYALLGPWSDGNVTRDKTLVSFVRLKRFLVLWQYC